MAPSKIVTSIGGAVLAAVALTAPAMPAPSWASGNRG